MQLVAVIDLPDDPTLEPAEAADAVLARLTPEAGFATFNDAEGPTQGPLLPTRVAVTLPPEAHVARRFNLVGPDSVDGVDVYDTRAGTSFYAEGLLLAALTETERRELAFALLATCAPEAQG